MSYFITWHTLSLKVSNEALECMKAIHHQKDSLIITRRPKCNLIWIPSFRSKTYFIVIWTSPWIRNWNNACKMMSWAGRPNMSRIDASWHIPQIMRYAVSHLHCIGQLQFISKTWWFFNWYPPISVPKRKPWNSQSQLLFQWILCCDWLLGGFLFGTEIGWY